MGSPLTDVMAASTFALVRGQTAIFDLLGLPVISTGRPFSLYRRVFFENNSAEHVLDELRGKVIVDVGCGLTPFASDSMFQACVQAGIDFYGIDPKIGTDFKFGWFDRLKVRVTGGADVNPDAPGTERALGAWANDLPFEDASVDLILSSWLLTVWIRDEELLADIYREFDRVLKPGGSIRVHPQPAWNPASIGNDGLRQRLENYDVSERFLFAPDLASLPPAYVRVMTKPVT